MHAVGGGIAAVGEIYGQCYIAGENVAGEVYLAEGAEKTAVAAGASADVAGECLHEWFEEAHRNIAGLEIQIQRFAERHYVAAYARMLAGVAGYVGVEKERAVFAVPSGEDVGIAYGAAVVSYGIHMQVVALQNRLGGQQRRCCESAGGAASDHGLVDFECLENRQQLDFRQVDGGYVGGFAAYGAVDGDALRFRFECEILHIDAGGAYNDFRRIDAPCLVAEVDCAGVEVHYGFHRA